MTDINWVNLLRLTYEQYVKWREDRVLPVEEYRLAEHESEVMAEEETLP
jgi:hypothetical protein